MSKRRAERIKCRITCELVVAGRGYRGIVLDMSETGVFVQTEATPPPGVHIRLRLHATGGIEVDVQGVVARRQVAPRELASVVRGGLGLRVEAPPPAYFELLGIQAGSSGSLPRGVGQPSASAKPAASGKQAPPPLKAASTSAHAPAAPKPAPAVDRRPEYRIRVKQTDGPRSRTLKLRAASKEEARESALRELGRGWEILSIEAA